ncbi:DUF6794 domain-containing protein [Flavobacterium sp.]
MKRKIILLITILLCLNCNRIDAPLYKAMEKFEDQIDPKELNTFINAKEERCFIALKRENKSLLMNEFYSNKQNSSLVEYFHSKGISHIGDMANIFIISLHRKLNSKDLNLEKQISDKMNYWKSIDDCKKFQQGMLKNNDKFIEGDTVQVRMRINSRDNCAYPIDCMEKDWKFDNHKDLLIKGVVLGKYTYDNIPKFVYMKMKIISLNKENVPVPRKLLKKGEEFSVVLNYDIIEPALRSVQK